MIYSSTNKHYHYLWKKYRPVLLKMMIDAENKPQEYQFYNHEFTKVNPRKKTGLSFSMQVAEGQPLDNIRNDEVAKDLLAVLNSSETATQLLSEHVFEFTLDKNFVLTIEKQEPVASVAD